MSANKERSWTVKPVPLSSLRYCIAYQCGGKAPPVPLQGEGWPVTTLDRFHTVNKLAVACRLSSAHCYIIKGTIPSYHKVHWIIPVQCTSATIPSYQKWSSPLVLANQSRRVQCKPNWMHLTTIGDSPSFNTSERNHKTYLWRNTSTSGLMLVRRLFISTPRVTTASTPETPRRASPTKYVT